MKSLKVLLLLLSICVISCKKQESQSNNKISEPNSQISTYYFIRHAEKDRSDPSNDNPHLTEAGRQRADKWTEILGEVKFDAVYTTNFYRTQETAQPIARRHNLKPTIYSPKTLDLNNFLEETQGLNVLVVGHSKSTPNFVNAILGNEKYSAINDNVFSNYFIVKIGNGQITDEKLSMP